MSIQNFPVPIFNPLIDRFISYLRFELNRATLTAEAYARDLNEFSNWLSKGRPGEIDFISVTTSDIRAWLASLSRAGESPRTVRRKTQSLRAFYRWLMKCNIIKISPLADIPLPKLSKPLPDIIRPEEIENALKFYREEAQEESSSDSLLKELVLEMLYSLGIRRAELVAIDDADISLSSGEIKITGKRSKQRVIPLPMQLLSKIRNWQRIRDEEFPDFPKPKPLFIIRNKRISPNQVYQIVNKALSGSSARKKSPHSLRHSFASAMLNGGAEIDSVREFLGHASLATTQIYTHISLSEIKKAYKSAHPRSNRSDFNQTSEKEKS